MEEGSVQSKSTGQILIDCQGTSKTVEPNVQLLPFGFKNYTGHAKVRNYFVKSECTDSCEITPTFEATFRGRELRGTKVSLTSFGVRGIIVEEEVLGQSTDQLEEEEEKGNNKVSRLWKKEKEFNEMMYWLREQNPSANDKVQKWIQWIKISKHLHSSVSADKLQQQLSSLTNSSNSAKKETTNDESNKRRRSSDSLPMESIKKQKQSSEDEGE